MSAHTSRALVGRALQAACAATAGAALLKLLKHGPRRVVPGLRELSALKEAAAGSGGGSEGNWKSTLQLVLPGIVVLRVNHVRSWDGEKATYSMATGFVVDKTRYGA